MHAKSATDGENQARHNASVMDTSPAYWPSGRRRKMFRPLKQSTTIRLDADVLDWLKAGGKGYQTRMNAILREAMRNDLS
jgi:uncharacterized protein (DUF4415 family)